MSAAASAASAPTSSAATPASTWSDRWAHYAEGELTLDPYDTARWARRVAGKVRLDMSYKPGDFLVAMLR
jgi:hypothetical protein